MCQLILDLLVYTLMTFEQDGSKLTRNLIREGEMAAPKSEKIWPLIVAKHCLKCGATWRMKSHGAWLL